MSNPVPIKVAYDVFEPIGGEDNRLSPVIFLHGLVATKEKWMDIPQRIADQTKRKVYAPDARNHGDSEYTDDFNFDVNVDDLFDFMDTINAPKAILVGHSMGAITAIRAALRNPEKVEMMLSEDTYTKILSDEVLDKIEVYVRCWSESVEKIPKDLNPTEALTYARNYMCNHSIQYLPYINERKMLLVPTKLKRTPDGFYKVSFNAEAVSKAMKDRKTLMKETTGQFDGPAYFLYGSRSSFAVEKEEEVIRKHFPSMKLVEIEGATHLAHYEFPEKFAEAILHCLKTGN